MKGTCIVLGLVLAAVHVSSFGADNTDQAKWNSCNDQARDLAGAAWKSSMDQCMETKSNSNATGLKKAPANSTKDKITGLPVYPGVTDPHPMPTTVVCKSQTSGSFFIVSGEKTREVANWYPAALPGFKKFTAVTDGRSQDTYFSAEVPRRSLLPVIRIAPKSIRFPTAAFIRVSRRRPWLPSTPGK